MGMLLWCKFKPILSKKMTLRLWQPNMMIKGNAAEYRYYDQEGALTNRSDTGYAILRFEYDELNRVVKEEYFNESNDPALTKKFGCVSIND
jgi:YD repeat-containing protein